MMTLILSSLLSPAMALSEATSVREGQGLPPVGSEAPGFTLNNQEGKPVSLKDFRGRWVVLYFYPKDFTKGCTIEAHNFQTDLKKYEKRKVVIVGVSVQDAKSHGDFCAKEGLHFKLLADVDHKASETYRSTMEYKGEVLSARNTFIIDAQGVIRKEWVKVDPTTHSNEVLASLADLQSKQP